MPHHLKHAMSRQRLSEELQNDADLEDVWFDYKECVTDHISEVEQKWDQLDDEVWAKVIVMEKNKRVAKVLLRKSQNIVNNSDVGYDSRGIIGLGGFSNDFRDKSTVEALRNVGKGINISMDNGGNILINKHDHKLISCQRLEDDSPKLVEEHKIKIFDMKQFQMLIKKEMRKPHPNLNDIRDKVVTNVMFSDPEADNMEHPLWIMIINIVALDLLNSRAKKMSSEVKVVTSTLIRDKSDTLTDDSNCGSDKKKIMGHPMSWHLEPPVPPVRNGSRLV